jgi:hypothetical protein
MLSTLFFATSRFAVLLEFGPDTELDHMGSDIAKTGVFLVALLQ